MPAQTLLEALGFDPGVADGIIGQNTINAVKRYEPSRGWPPSGEIDIRLLESLRASKAAPAASPVKPATGPGGGLSNGPGNN
ncbi:MAG: peptidoglycan-binding protein [Rhodospirillales bacterium]|nr:peptidoglycan-binding protein [Rhodospirillales bacterium]